MVIYCLSCSSLAQSGIHAALIERDVRIVSHLADRC
jgi:hypothetical protein